MNTIDLIPFRAAIQERICTFCLDGGQDGSCRRLPDDPCALVTHLDQLVHAVVDVGVSDDLDDYVTKIRSEVCPTCRQDPAGDCGLRTLAECAADAYLLPVVGVIEDVAEQQGILGR